MTNYDALTVAQKRLVCRKAQAVYQACVGKTGRAASHAEAVGRLCHDMPLWMCAMVEAFADSVRSGEFTLESLDTP